MCQTANTPQCINAESSHGNNTEIVSRFGVIGDSNSGQFLFYS